MYLKLKIRHKNLNSKNYFMNLTPGCDLWENSHFITIFNDLLSSKSDIKKQMHKVLGAKNKNIFHGLNVT